MPGIMGSGEAEGGVSLRRFGLNFDPPSLVLEYERVGSGRLFHRRIGLRRLGPSSDPSRTAEKIRRQNKALLAEDQVPFEQLVSVVARLQAKQGGEKATPAVPPAVASEGIEDLPELEGDLDLNKLSTEELDRYKARMDVEYYRNQSKPGDPGFKYDVRVDHELGEDAASCGWDDSGSEGDELKDTG